MVKKKSTEWSCLSLYKTGEQIGDKTKKDNPQEGAAETV